MLDATLLLYHHFLKDNAPTIMEYVQAFSRHSRFPVVAVNTDLGFPKLLRKYSFRSIILHYSIFGSWPWLLDQQYYDYLAGQSASYKVAIFQDEYHNCQPRFQFINEYKIDCVLTCLAPEYIPAFYGKYTSAPRIETVLTGYVSAEMLEAANKFYRPDALRPLDISYRGRPLPFYFGKGAREKTEIGERFLERAQGYKLNLDIKTGEADRIYGSSWYEFLAKSKGVLGVESGVSYCDIEDRVRPAIEKKLKENPAITFDQLFDSILAPWEGNIPIRTISPRHFEASVLRVCQILYEGEYSGILKAMVHYIPLKKDFSNFEEVMALFLNPEFRKQITENAYRDIIASGLYTYDKFVERIDRILEENGLVISQDLQDIQVLRKRLAREVRGLLILRVMANYLTAGVLWVRFSWLVQTLVKPVLRPFLLRTGILKAGEQ